MNFHEMYEERTKIGFSITGSKFLRVPHEYKSGTFLHLRTRCLDLNSSD
jgi:hypothetical protein